MQKEKKIFIIASIEKNYTDFIHLGKETLKYDKDNFVEYLYDLTSIDIVINFKKDLCKSKFLRSIREKSCVFSLKTLESESESESNLVEATSKLYLMLLNYYVIKLSSKKYYEAMPWLLSYCKIFILYNYIFDVGFFIYGLLSNTSSLSNLDKTHVFFKYLKFKYKNLEFISKEFLQFLDDFCKWSPMDKRVLRIPIRNYKLDFSGSGLILTALLTNQKDLLNFSGIHLDNNNEIHFGYKQILDKLKDIYNVDRKDYLGINKFLSHFDVSWHNMLKEIIISREIVKDGTMVKGYSGTTRGLSDKIEDRISNFLISNFLYQKHIEKVFTSLRNMSQKIAETINNLIDEHCPSIHTVYLRLIVDLVDKIRLKKNNEGIIIPLPHVRYKLEPKTHKIIPLKLSTVIKGLNKNKLQRTSRRKAAYHTTFTDYRKLKSSFGADLIHGYDALVAYYIKEIIHILAPSLQIASIFDAFIFSEEIPLSTFKDICRLACQLAFKDSSFVRELLTENKVPFTEFHKVFDKNIFDPLQHNILENIIESDFLSYLYKNQDEWFKSKKPKFKYFIHSLNFMNIKEQEEYDKYIAEICELPKIKGLNYNFKIFGKDKINTTQNTKFTPEYISQMEKLIKRLENAYKQSFVIKKIIETDNQINEHLFNSNENNTKTVINSLREIINNDKFVK